MKQVLIRQGQAIVEEVPAPMIESGTLLIQVQSSCISIGTEMSGVRASGLPLWKRALNQPQNVKKVFQMVASQGLAKTKNAIEGKLSSGQATGYSAAGIIIEVGKGVDGFQVGDRVACAGAQCAHHAEYIRVPKNLSVLVPDEIGIEEASTVTLGAIALQGVRRASPTLGETFVVIGLGILGQLAVQMLKANGCRVIGVDLDRSRIDLAKKLGMSVGIHPDDGDDANQVARLSDGCGADGVIITAASPSNEIISTAFNMCRKKGRVVLVGDVGLNLNRADFYAKEIDFFISTSYGPGRYDSGYEERGLDYPISYVRWTENRNMGEYLRLVADGQVNLKPLMSSTFLIDDARQAYDSLKEGGEKPLMVLLSYPQQEQGALSYKVQNPAFNASDLGKKIRVAIAGAGAFAKGMHLPNLQSLSDKYQIQSIMSRTGHNAVAATKQFAADYSTTNYEEILADPNIDLVLIATRHNLHSNMTLSALKAGKHVLVEKPLALTLSELGGIESFYMDGDSNKPVVLTGFNRRFSPFATRIASLIENRSNPLIINYQMNAGYIPLDHWVHTEEGGGRNIGEACHIYDLFTFLTNSPVTSIHAQSINPKTGHYSKSDNFVAVMSFEDGSVATLTYTALGSKDYSKEKMEIFFDGKVIVMDDYKNLSMLGAKMKSIELPLQDKGQKHELEILANKLQAGEWPIPLWQQIQAMKISFSVQDQLANK